MQNFRYALPQVVVHWLAAAAVIFLMATGMLVLEDMPNNPAKIGNITIHMGVGALAGLLVLVRIVLRKRLPAPPAAPGDGLARAGHMALNLAVLLMAVSGMLLMIQSGAIGAVFGSGALPADFHDFLPRKVHGLVAKLVLAFVALHVLAALYHQLIVRDGLLGRMSFGRK
ncbi:MAG: cytochrome b/b6 domain-containing protein [Rhodocyclaceae bacterium]|jgi:cytochrome b561|nr:cytochrome b/b6 domain-containing protein [Rhodocyclaceae bacterium]